MHGPAHRHALAKAPVAARRPRVTTWHGIELVDDYAWLRADNWQEVMRDPAALDAEIRAYLEAENAYCEAQLSDTRPLQDELFTEMKGRLKENDSTVPAPDGPFAYYSSFVAGGQYPLLVPHGPRRRARDRSARRQRRGQGQALLGPRLLAAQPRPQAARLRQRRPRLGALHHPLPRPGDGRGSARLHPRYARRLRLGQRQPHAVLRAPRRASPPAARLPPRRRHAGRRRRARLRGEGHGFLRRAVGERSRRSSSSSMPTTHQTSEIYLDRRRRAARSPAHRRAAPARARVRRRAPRRQALSSRPTRPGRRISASARRRSPPPAWPTGAS